MVYLHYNQSEAYAIDLDDVNIPIPWEFISTYMFLPGAIDESLRNQCSVTGRTAQSCRKHWLKMFPYSQYTCAPYHKRDMNNPSSSSSSMQYNVPASLAQGSYLRSLSTRNTEKVVGNKIGKASEISVKSRPRKNWSKAEIEQIHELQKKYGNKWTKLAVIMGGKRTPNELKNYWHQLHRKQKEQQILANHHQTK